MNKLIDLTAITFGEWKVVARAESSKPPTYWLCECTCGTVRPVSGKSLRRGVSTSCGCSSTRPTTHGHSRKGNASPTYKCWLAMRRRCLPTAQPFTRRHYADRGIRVCDRWGRFENFLSDMGERPPGSTLERVNNDSDYCPSNCIWTNRTSQSRNTRANRWVVLRGESMVLKDAATKLGVTVAAIYNLAKRHGIEIQQAVNGTARLDGVGILKLLRDNTALPASAIDLTGKRFGLLTVWQPSKRRSSSRQRYWICSCECGKREFEVNGANLRNGNTRSCGCSRRGKYRASRLRRVRHGHSTPATPTYISWQCMRQRSRCNGVPCSPRWAMFENFLTDMGERPEGHTLDRRDNSLGYDPENCRWANRSTQNRNTRANRWISLRNETMVLQDAARRIGVAQNTVYGYMKRHGIDAQQAIDRLSKRYEAR